MLANPDELSGLAGADLAQEIIDLAAQGFG
jgi:hypothetical protein